MWTSLDPVVVRDGIIEISRGNWGQGRGVEPLIRPKWLAVLDIDGQRIHGTPPLMPWVKESTIYPMEAGWETRIQVAIPTKFKDGRPHTYTAHIFVANYFEGWGDVPENRWEWGHYNSAHDAPARVAGVFTVNTAPEPSPEPTPAPTPAPKVTLASAQTKALAALYELVEAQRAAGRTDAYIADTLYYQIIRALLLPVGDGKRHHIKLLIKQALG
jgi:hypothetical protein